MQDSGRNYWLKLETGYDVLRDGIGEEYIPRDLRGYILSPPQAESSQIQVDTIEELVEIVSDHFSKHDGASDLYITFSQDLDDSDGSDASFPSGAKSSVFSFSSLEDFVHFMGGDNVDDLKSDDAFVLFQPIPFIDEAISYTSDLHFMGGDNVDDLKSDDAFVLYQSLIPFIDEAISYTSDLQADGAANDPLQKSIGSNVYQVIKDELVNLVGEIDKENGATSEQLTAQGLAYLMDMAFFYHSGKKDDAVAAYGQYNLFKKNLSGDVEIDIDELNRIDIELRNLYIPKVE